jgi:hypothetical protein
MNLCSFTCDNFIIMKSTDNNNNNNNNNDIECYELRFAHDQWILKKQRLGAA